MLERRTMDKFRTVIRSARFIHSPYTATEMQGFAQVPATWLPRLQGGWLPCCILLY